MTDLVASTRQQENWVPSAHECLKPLEARSLLTGDGQNGSWCWLRWLLPPGSDAGALLVRRSACLFCILFICSIHLYVTCGPCHPRYVHRAQLARGRKILTVLPPAHSLCQVCCLYRYLRFFRPLTRCASSTLGSAITARDSVQCSFRVVVEWGKRSTWEVGSWQVQRTWEPISAMFVP